MKIVFFLKKGLSRISTEYMLYITLIYKNLNNTFLKIFYKKKLNDSKTMDLFDEVSTLEKRIKKKRVE